MKISFVKIPPKVTRKILVEAFNFYAKKLVSSQLAKRLVINVVFDENIQGKGQIVVVDSRYFPREFKIIVDPKQAKKEILSTLAHEFVHLKQYARGELKDYSRYPGKARFLKRVYTLSNGEDEAYWFAPWEIQAYGLEHGLYNLFENELSKRKKYGKKN